MGVQLRLGLDIRSTSSSASGLNWVGSVIWWVGLGRVDKNRPMENSALYSCVLCVIIVVYLSCIGLHTYYKKSQIKRHS